MSLCSLGLGKTGHLPALVLVHTRMIISPSEGENGRE
jgi:hypothetical protein